MSTVEHRLVEIETSDTGSQRWLCTCGDVGQWRWPSNVRVSHAMHRSHARRRAERPAEPSRKA